MRRRGCFWSAYPTCPRSLAVGERPVRRRRVWAERDASRSSHLTTKPFAPAWRLIRMRRSRSCRSACGRMQGQGQHRLPVEQAEVSQIAAQKKSLRASEQDRPDVAEARDRWRANQPELKSERLVFIDETGAVTDMRAATAAVRAASASFAACRGDIGKRRPSLPHCGSRGRRALCADGPMDGESFRAYVEQFVVPILKPAISW